MHNYVQQFENVMHYNKFFIGHKKVTGQRYREYVCVKRRLGVAQLGQSS